MHVEFIAQSGFIITLTNGKKLAIDLWLDNPVNPKTVDDIPNLNYIFITHDHPDHGLKDAIDLAKRDSALFVSTAEISKFAMSKGVKITDRGNIGGYYAIDENIDVQHTIAHHSSDIGIPSGIMIKTMDGIIYHMGDTGYFEETKIYSELNKIKLLLVPIGSRYTMDSVQASFAVKNLKPEVVIPMHYNTFDKIAQDPQVFKTKCKELIPSASIQILSPGESIEI